MKITLTLAAILITVASVAQNLDQTAAFRDNSSDHYVRFHYDNDYFTALDRYYTQGYNFELVAPRLKNNFVNYILIKPLQSQHKYGTALEHIGYAPTSIKSDYIRYGDRPFAAAISVKSSIVSTDTVQHSRWVTSLTVGLIGPGAFGCEMQEGIHKWVGDEIPYGWQYQIKNDLVLNYELGYEKQLLRVGNIASLQTNASIHAGTLFTNLSVGVTATAGLVNAPFGGSKVRSRFRLYLYSQPVVRVIGFDATLQGGLFNRKSPYTISNKDIERITARDNFGIVLQYRGLNLEYSRTLITREFTTGSSHKWGGFRIGFNL